MKCAEAERLSTSKASASWRAVRLVVSRRLGPRPSWYEVTSDFVDVVIRRDMLRIDMRLVPRRLPERHSRKLGDWSHMYGPEGISFYTRGEGVMPRWPGPATAAIELGSRRTR